MTSGLSRWERRAEIPLMIGALIFLVVYAVPILVPDLSREARLVCRSITWATWLAFVADYVARLILAGDWRRYLKGHLADLLVIALPLLRPLRLLRLVTLLAVLNRRAGLRLRGRIGAYVVGGASLLAFCSSLAVLDAERHSDQANILTFGDAIWWSLTTMTTVGYGDHYPVTTGGRWIAAMLMIGGIALVGVVTGTFASWLVEAVRGNAEDADLRSQLEDLHAKLDVALSQVRADPRPALALPDPHERPESELPEVDPGPGFDRGATTPLHASADDKP